MNQTVMFFGDSIANGQGVALHEGWVSRISAEMPEGWMVVSASRNGDTTRQALERMPYEVQAHEPAILVVQFGLNDANHWESDRGLPRVSIDAYEANLREIVYRGLAFGAQRILLLTNHVPDGMRQRSLFPDVVGDYNARVRDIADPVIPACRIPKVVLVDMEAQTGYDEVTLDDGVHLNSRGHELYHRALLPALMEAIRDVASAISQAA